MKAEKQENSENKKRAAHGSKTRGSVRKKQRNNTEKLRERELPFGEAPTHMRNNRHKTTECNKIIFEKKKRGCRGRREFS